MPERTCEAKRGKNLCTLPAGHTGPHEAWGLGWGGRREPFDRWNDEPATPPSAEPERRDTTDAGDVLTRIIAHHGNCHDRRRVDGVIGSYMFVSDEDSVRLRTLRERLNKPHIVHGEVNTAVDVLDSVALRVEGLCTDTRGQPCKQCCEAADRLRTLRETVGKLDDDHRALCLRAADDHLYRPEARTMFGEIADAIAALTAARSGEDHPANEEGR